ncbi:hypothetical protein LOTGIDRAFT_162035 [Lottia gigantea]|uniref:FAN-like N-terminal PH domain-containing protein n=1 Tax=Lottia gigantea TaxID=225164 RepID=V4AD32_LOTGI|nr:hypothetical protein LOTGIDRAFT_162035 [Lottia gigantea]ESO93010.1 hypothetical protein LOTGIDRAFT_162035 [Lottia gigantea]
MAFLETDTLGQERFSLLLLEPGEIYFEDFSVFFCPSGLPEVEPIKKKQRGHLKVCSKSILFVPGEIHLPIIKFPLKNVDLIDEWTGGLFSKYVLSLNHLVLFIRPHINIAVTHVRYEELIVLKRPMGKAHFAKKEKIGTDLLGQGLYERGYKARLLLIQ